MAGLMRGKDTAVYGEDLDPAAPMDHYQMRIPWGTPIDGAVAELSRDERGIITAEIRIPAPEPRHG
jgi:hypothetical protein